MSTFHDKLAKLILRYGTLAGRIFLALIFLGAAFNKITNFAGVRGYMQSAMGGLSEGVLSFLLAGAIAFLVVGGLSVLLGCQVRTGALLLFVFLVIVTPIFHPFWAVPAEQFQMQMVNFQKNLAIMGGLMLVMAFGAGPLSVDAWLQTRQSAEVESGPGGYEPATVTE
ncbi:DoxX family protein [bacterium]|nr:DoxX family protein [bacterium]